MGFGGLLKFLEVWLRWSRMASPGSTLSLAMQPTSPIRWRNSAPTPSAAERWGAARPSERIREAQNIRYLERIYQDAAARF